MARPTFTVLSQRYLDLIGDSDGTIDDFGKRNINLAIKDILNRYNFSWSLATDDLTLSSGTADLPSDYNQTWGFADARIVVSGDGGDHAFTKINIADRDSYSSDNYVYWITYSTTGDKYVFNSKTLTGTVTVYYSTLPADLVNTTDPTIIPDTEAVCYLAASKNWVGSERDIELEREYKNVSDQLITAMYLRDMQDTVLPFAGTVSYFNLS